MNGARSEQWRKIIIIKTAIHDDVPPEQCYASVELGQVHWPYNIKKKQWWWYKNNNNNKKRGRKKKNINLKKVAKERESARTKRRKNLK